MSEIKDPILFGVIANAVGFAYIWAVDPDRVETDEKRERREVLAQPEEMEIINKITSSVYQHLVKGNFVEEQPRE